MFARSHFLVLLSAVMAGESAAAADKTRLPFQDGIYMTDTQYCGARLTELFDSFDGKLAWLLRDIDGSTVGAGPELLCNVSNVKVVGIDVNFDASCQIGDETRTIAGHYRKMPSGFSISGKPFYFCTGQEFYQNLVEAEELVDKWHDANGRCRGSSDPAVWEPACNERSRLDERLADLNQCYGREGEAGYEMNWHVCEPGSNRD